MGSDEFVALMDIQRSWTKALDQTRNRSYWHNSITKERTWVDPRDPVLTHRNTVVQKFVRLLSEAGVSLDVVEDVFRVFDEDSSGEY